MSRVLPFGPSQAAELVNTEAKRESTARARAALLGTVLRRQVGNDGQVVFAIGLRRFATIDEVEDYFDQVRGDE